MACQIELQKGGDLSFPYVSEGCSTLLEISPLDLLSDPSCFLKLIHPEDISSFQDTLNQSAHTMRFWNWQGRILFPGTRIKWVNLRAEPHSAQSGLTRWDGILLDITQSKLGELEIMRTQQQLQELFSHIQDVKEQERLHIAREVHDEFGSLLTAIKIDLSWLIQRLPQNNQLLIDKAKTIEELVNKAISSANNLAHRLRPDFLDHFGFIAAIEIEAQEFSKRSGISCTIIASHEDIELPSSHSITLFRIFQETLNNILKHAKAKSARVKIAKTADHLEFIISDDGVGFGDMARNKPRTFGLRGIHERVAHLGGSVNIASSIESGTQITIIVPLGAKSSNADTLQRAVIGDIST